MNIVLKLIFPILLISTIIYIITIAFSGLFINIDIIKELFIFIKSSMLSFDWLIPYNTQIIAINTFILVELGILSIKIIRFISNMFRI
jgi:hypothetical protein